MDVYTIWHSLKPFLSACMVVWMLCCCGSERAQPLPETVGEAPTQAAAASATASASPTPLLTPVGRIRPSALAGNWYPADPDELADMVDTMLAATDRVGGQPIGLIVPHAGYVYSGPVAAYGLRQLEDTDIETAVIIAADHQAPLSDPIAVWAEGGFETPLGVVPVDQELAQALVQADPRIKADLAAHAGEHPIEIELPFLQRVCPTCRIVPVLMGADDDKTVQALADALLQVLPGRRAVVIASSDLSHYPRREDALRVDGATLGAIETGDPVLVRQTIQALMGSDVPNLLTCACGEGPILVTMKVAAGLGANTVTILRYANSADSPYGEPDRVVGYGAVMLWRYQAPQISDAQRAELLRLARDTIATYLESREIPEYAAADPLFRQRSGAFVTLKKGDELRGCIGHMEPDQPLYRAVQEMAVSAATADPRFPPLTKEELDQVRIEISVLSPLHRITDLSQIEVGKHGLMLVQDGQRGVLLPQVPVEQGWDRQQFLAGLCQKAGLSPTCWQDHPTLYTFTAVVFAEE